MDWSTTVELTAVGTFLKKNRILTSLSLALHSLSHTCMHPMSPKSTH